MRGDRNACTEQLATGDAQRVANASAKSAVTALTGAPAKATAKWVPKAAPAASGKTAAAKTKAPPRAAAVAEKSRDLPRRKRDPG